MCAYRAAVYLLLTCNGGSQANGAENKIFNAYIIEFSDHIDPARNTDISGNTHSIFTLLMSCTEYTFLFVVFFASLPALIQSTIIETIAGNMRRSTADSAYSSVFFATASLEKKDAIRAYQALFDYIHNYSRHAYKYLVLRFRQLHEYAA